MVPTAKSTVTPEPGHPHEGRPARLLWELRFVGEVGAFFASAAPGMALAPRGEPCTVLILPGFMAADRSTSAMRLALRGLGHDVHGWGLGANVGPADHVVEGLRDQVARLVRRSGGPIDVVGWSLGGVYGRVLASNRPEQVRQVITLGSPIRMRNDQTNLAGTFRRFARGFGFPDTRVVDVDRVPVPSTAVWTRTDGIVPGVACRQTPGPRAENVEVRSTHVGLTHNPAVLWVVADRLAQPDGSWTPFRPPAALRPMIPSWEGGVVPDAVIDLRDRVPDEPGTTRA
jgi:pimeloyl-ACP methyl ester carboxylesterase